MDDTVNIPTEEAMGLAQPERVTYYVARPQGDTVQLANTDCKIVIVEHAVASFYRDEEDLKPLLILHPGTWTTIHLGPFPGTITLEPGQSATVGPAPAEPQGNA